MWFHMFNSDFSAPEKLFNPFSVFISRQWGNGASEKGKNTDKSMEEVPTEFHNYTTVSQKGDRIHFYIGMLNSSINLRLHSIGIWPIKNVLNESVLPWKTYFCRWKTKRSITYTASVKVVMHCQWYCRMNIYALSGL